MKRKGSRHHQFAKRIPSDIAPRMVGMRLDVPLGEATVQVMVGKNATIRLSLRTDRPNEVNQRQADALSYLAKVFEAVRASCPIPLSHFQCVALSERLYSP